MFCPKNPVTAVGTATPAVRGRGMSDPGSPRLHRRPWPARPDHESGPLLGLADGKPQLDQQDATAGEHPFEFRRLPHELLVLRIGAETITRSTTRLYQDRSNSTI